MKKIIFSFIALILVSFVGNSQRLNRVPPSAGIDFPDGWHKFIEQGATFDVEVLGKKLVKGNVTWFDQSKYSGSFVGHTIAGKGTYTWPNGQRYEGSFKSNMKHGWGQMYYIDGSRYNGKWKADKKEGKGKMYDKDGNVTQEGYWSDDEFVGAKKSKKKKGN